MKAGRMAIKMWHSLTAGGCFIVGLGAVDPANAHPRTVPTAQLQRLSADLMRSHTQDFFKLGRIKLEREVQIINQPRSQLDVDVLIINPSIQLQPDLSPLEMPLRPSPPTTR